MSDEKPKRVPAWHWSVVPGEQWTNYYRMTHRLPQPANGSSREAQLTKKELEPKTYSD